jgi:hypothetical protein
VNIISEQVKILLQRMDERPEDFFKDPLEPIRYQEPTTWSRIAALGYFNIVERILVHFKFRKIRRLKTQQEIIECLLQKNTEASDAAYPTITIPSGSSLQKQPMRMYAHNDPK